MTGWRKRQIEEEQRTTWPFPSEPPDHEPLDKLPFNPDNEEEAPL